MSNVIETNLVNLALLHLGVERHFATQPGTRWVDADFEAQYPNLFQEGKITVAIGFDGYTHYVISNFSELSEAWRAGNGLSEVVVVPTWVWEQARHNLKVIYEI